MGISVNVNPKLVSELNALIDGKIYHTRDEAVEDAIKVLIALRGELYTRTEIKEVLSKYIYRGKKWKDIILYVQSKR